jgi:branched-subunit amino acid transport protein
MAKNTDVKTALGQLEDTLETYLVDKAPFSIPDNFKELIVKFSPWISLILLLVALPAILAIFGLGAILTPFSFLGGISAGYNYIFTLAFSVVTLVLEALAIPGLFKRSLGGWRFAYYAALVSAVQNLVTFNLGGLVIGGLVSMYVLFQIKSYYK